MANSFTPKSQSVLNLSLQAASEMGHTYIGSEHLLMGLLLEEGGVASHYLRERGLEKEKLRNAIARLAGIGSPSTVSATDMTPRTRSIIENSYVEAQRHGKSHIGTEHLLVALLQERDCVAVRILESMSLPVSELRSDLFRYLGNPESGDAIFAGESKPSRVKSAIDDTSVLKNHGRDLTAMAKNGELDPIIGRDRETERVIQILSRRTKSNPCLIGEPGVGKTAVVEGLAQRIADGNVPESLADRVVVTLDIASMIAGAKYRGEFEERLKNVLAEIRKRSGIILFIDEIHTIIGAGSAEGAVDAANIIKPALARGELQVIGATTLSEYRKHIEKDAALERRFQSVLVGEPTHEETVAILRGLRHKYEDHHKLTIDDEAIEAAVTLSSRYITDRFLPDKAIDLIDEAASRLRILAYTFPPELKEAEVKLKELSKEKEAAILEQQFEKAAMIRDEEVNLKEEWAHKKELWETQKKDSSLTVNSATVADIVTQWTGIPVHRLLEEESERLLRLEDSLKARVIGQNDAVESISRAIRRGRTGLKDPKRPIGSFVFLGSTGIGKTELAKALADVLFGSAEALIRLDMSEYMEKHSVSKLIGSPPGYVGFEEGGQLTEKIRRKPYAVILFDEIEKAHPDVFNLLLQILEDGILTDSQGRTVNFRNTVIILTSNAGAREGFSSNKLGFTSSEQVQKDEDKERMLHALKDTFRPEFLNRIDEIIVFRPLTPENIEQIAELMLKEVEKRIVQRGMRVHFDPSVKKLLAKEGFNAVYGARPLRRATVRLVEDPFSTEILEGRIREGDLVNVTAEDEKILFSVNR